jgi:hypothetical protein
VHIPLVLLERISKEGRPLMPHEVPTFILQHAEASPPDQARKVGQAWQLMVQWCVVAAQKDGQGDSIVAFAVKAITKTDDTYFCQLVKGPLNGTMGTRPSRSPQPGMPLGGTPAQVHGQFAA